LTIISDNVDALVNDASHQASLIGSVHAPALSKFAITANQGDFHLFIKDPNNAATKRMEYSMRLNTQEGKPYFFEGFKEAHNDKKLDLWGDTTTLFITIYEGENNKAPVFGKGILVIKPEDFAKQMTTMKAVNAKNVK